jgi:Beta-lactamase class C and other penicillin binding proteins
MLNLKKRIILRNPVKLIVISLALLGLLCGIKPALLVINDDKDDNDAAIDTFNNLEPFITAKMKKHLVPGLSMVIFKDQKIIYSKGFGVKNASTGEPVNEDTIFEAASLSKTLTAYAAMILVERGKLSLDEPLNQYLKHPYLPEQKYADAITLRMILNHTSGLSNDSDGKDRKVYFTPGGYFSYSGAGFRYLQQVIEDVTGFPFTRFMDKEIIQPLEMKSSSFVLKDEMLPLMANGHEAGKAFPIKKMDVNAAYSLLTTPTDMAKFNIEICHPTLLKPATVAKMLSPTVKWQDDIYWGLGIGLLKFSQDEQNELYWHWGNLYYYCNMMIVDKDSKTGVVIMTNGNTGMRVAERLAIKIMNEYVLEPGKDIERNTFDFIT